MTPREFHHLAGLLLNVAPEGTTLVGNALGNLRILDRDGEYIGWVDLGSTVDIHDRIHMINREAGRE